MIATISIEVAIGFLGTMFPKRTGAEPLSTLAIILLALGLVLASLTLLAGQTGMAEALHLLTLAGIAIEATRRARVVAVAAPPSFVLVPAGAALGAAGAALLLAAPELALGRTLAAQGLMLSLVLAVAPILLPGILGVEAPWGMGRGRHLAIALLLAISFAVEQWLSTRGGLWLRATVCALALTAAGALAPTGRPGAHRALFRVALWLVPFGLLAAGSFPERRVALLHLTYVGGFAGLIFAVSVHVTLFHGGRAAVADRWPMRVVLGAACLLGAAGTRAVLEGFGARYLDAMVVAAGLWLVAVAAWSAFLLPYLRRRRS